MENMQKCIDTCLACFASCEHNATICIDEGFAHCAKRCRDCADVCMLCVKLMARGSEFHEEFCKLCAEVCNECALQCDVHAPHHEHCRKCAEKCRACAKECEGMAA